MPRQSRGKQYDIRGLVIVGTLGLIITMVLVTLYGDYLGIRLIKKGSPRLSVHRGDKVTLELANSPYTRKLEICTEKKNLILGYSDFTDCRPLRYHVGPHVTKADVTIPNNFPLARAVVITRLRDANGTLVPAAPTDEKIALWITKAKPQPVAVNDEGGENGGGSGGGGGGDSGGGGGNDNSGDNQAENTIAFNLQRVCIDPIDYEVFLQWKPQNSIVRFRPAGDDQWYRPYIFGDDPYTNEEDFRYVLTFNLNTDPAYYNENNEREGYPLGPNEDFEFRFETTGSDPVQYSETFRFNTQTKPEGASDWQKYCIYP